jgi:hypothetical protein
MKRLADFKWSCGLFGVALLLCGAAPAGAKSGVETSGDILLFVLPAAGAGLTLAYRDKEGALQFGESAAVQIARTNAP